MDTIIACRYNGGVIIAADSAQARSILIYKDDLDKIHEISENVIMGQAGPNSDVVSFGEYVEKNLKLYQLGNDGRSMSTKSAANFVRGELAKALRKGPYQTNIMLGGFDEGKGESLYYVDYMGTLQVSARRSRGSSLSSSWAANFVIFSTHTHSTSLALLGGQFRSAGVR